jgi:general secretion pathway protein I
MLSVGKNRGFTLLEVLIALAILAIALSAAMRVAGIATNTTAQIKQRIVAHWIAENRLTELRVGVWPPTGVNTGDVSQAGLTLRWEETINGTPNVNFRRVEIRVFSPDQPNYAYADLVAYLPSQR